MGAMITWQFGEKQVRTVEIDGQPWWVAKDICAVLDLSNTTMAVAGLAEDERGINKIDTLGGPQEIIIINEPGLYRLIFSSRKPEAETFRRWVLHEVLPQIRKYGAYGAQSAVFSLLSDQITKQNALIAEFIAQSRLNRPAPACPEASKQDAAFRNAMLKSGIAMRVYIYDHRRIKEFIKKSDFAFSQAQVVTMALDHFFNQ